MKTNEKLKRLRLHYGYSQEKLAKKIFISRQAIAKWESGDSMPDHEHLKKVALVYQISIDALLDDNKDVFTALNEQVSLKAPIILGIIYMILSIIFGVLSFVLDVGFIPFFLVIGMLFLTVMPMVGIFTYAIKTNDFSMLAGYQTKKKYHIPVLKRMLVTMKTLILIYSIITILLYGLNFVIEDLKHTRFNIILLLLFCVNLVLIVLLVNHRNKDKLYLNA